MRPYVVTNVNEDKEYLVLADSPGEAINLVTKARSVPAYGFRAHDMQSDRAYVLDYRNRVIFGSSL